MAVFLTVLVPLPPDVRDVLPVEVVTVSVPPLRFDPVRSAEDRRAVFRSTTREAVEASGSISTLFLLEERSLDAIRCVRSPLAFPPPPMTFIRDVPASTPVAFGCVALAVFRLDTRP